MDHKEIEQVGVNWIHLSQGTAQWWALMSTERSTVRRLTETFGLHTGQGLSLAQRLLASQERLSMELVIT
jgi:hypothetical protein